MENGTLQYKIITGGGLDASGDPIQVTEDWSEPIDCWIKTNLHNQKGKYEDGKFTMAKYEVLIELQPFEADRIKLITDKNKDLGEFQIQDCQFLDIAGRVKIMV